jgi:muramoyltetrapeptide carboxypeptidase
MSWEKITYPSPLKKGSVIGITAPSSGVSGSFEARLNLVIRHLKDRGFEVKEGKCLRSDFKSVSAPAQERAADFIKLWNDPSVDAIVPPWGGEFLLNLLPYLDFEELAKNPKWLLGYSDTSTLLFAITTMTGISTAHGMNLMDAVLNQSDGLSEQTYKILSLNPGDSVTQLSSKKYQLHFKDFSEDVGVTFNLTEKTEWKSLRNLHEAEFSGRLIGGCLDTLRNLVGTPYGNLSKFATRFRKDGLILYLENSGSTPSEVCRSLWNMKLAGWFDQVNGVLLGRSGGPDATRAGSFSYRDALNDVFADTRFPVIYDVDIGHLPPQLTILNGSLGTIKYKNGAGSLTQTLI